MTRLTTVTTVCGYVMVALGFTILAMWAVFLAAGVMEEGIWTVENDQYLVFHVAAEALMGAVLIAGGSAILRKKCWAMPPGLAGLGMTVYSTINSLGHSTRNERALTPVLLFAFLLAMSISVMLVREYLHTERDPDHGRIHTSGRIRAGHEDEPAREAG